MVCWAYLLLKLVFQDNSIEPVHKIWNLPPLEEWHYANVCFFPVYRCKLKRKEKRTWNVKFLIELPSHLGSHIFRDGSAPGSLQVTQNSLPKAGFSICKNGASQAFGEAALKCARLPGSPLKFTTASPEYSWRE